MGSVAETAEMVTSGVGHDKVKDQYADGKADMWQTYIGPSNVRTHLYRSWMCTQLRSRDCNHILDVACGTGVDSIMLLEESFVVTSIDASDKMLKYALKERWMRRQEEAFDKWVVEEANWLTLLEDLQTIPERPSGGYDAVVCLGNSFAHLPDTDGTLTSQKLCLRNFHDVLRPGGILIIDHRNFDEIIKTGMAPSRNVYYNNAKQVSEIVCMNTTVNGKPRSTTLDCVVGGKSMHLTFYPHRVRDFTDLLLEVFGRSSTHELYEDFHPAGSRNAHVPAYYIHVIQKR